MKENYYSIDDILASGERVPTRFNLTVPGIGHLEGQPGRPIAKDTKVELPFWLAEILATTSVNEHESFVLLLTPDSLGPTVQNAIKSDAVSLDLHSILPNYYKFTEKYCNLFSDAELQEVLKQLCMDRSFEIYSFASNVNKQINNDFILSLDEFEKKLYRKSVDANRQMRDWFRD